jgi:hypothetical protein
MINLHHVDERCVLIISFPLRRHRALHDDTIDQALEKNICLWRLKILFDTLRAKQ